MRVKGIDHQRQIIMVLVFKKPFTGTTKQHLLYVGNQMRGFGIDIEALKVEES